MSSSSLVGSGTSPPSKRLPLNQMAHIMANASPTPAILTVDLGF